MMTTSTEIDIKIEKLIDGFQKVLYSDDEIFMENMKTMNLAGDDINKYRYWEWTQGVGLYGIWKIFSKTKEQKYLEMLTKYYDRQLEIGFPSLNVNTIAPFLAMSFVGEYTKDMRYIEPCKTVAKWIMEQFPRTSENGFQHITSDTINDQELWDDTLFMTVLFLANMGRILKKEDYIDEAVYQFLLHIKYLQSKRTGLFYHGWTFNGNHNFSEAFWGRGNCWITIVIPEFIEIVKLPKSIEKFLVNTLNKQIKSLETYQNDNGMWHTIIDDETSYVEASATCGFAYGILRGISLGLVDTYYKQLVEKAVLPILSYINEEGILNQVSYGTAMGRDSLEFYKRIPLIPMPYGQALAILFLFEFKE